MRRLLMLCLFCLSPWLSNAAHAFTPENGFYWNSAQPGRGYTIEIQDNFLFLIVYIYRPDGSATWYTAQGLMQGNTVFNGTLDATTGGQCIGCPFTSPVTQVNAAGPISLVFDTETSARLTWSAGSFDITRFDYYLTRTPGDERTEMMLGEWQTILDYANVPGFTGYPFFGDVLIFSSVDRNEDPDFFDGCRADDSLLGRCSQQALDSSDATGFYDAAQGLHFLVVNNSANDLVIYVVRTGTEQFDGYAKICPKNVNAGACVQNNTTYPQTPVRGFRSASRNFVQNGSGPNKAATSHSRALPMIVGDGRKQIGMSETEVMQRYAIDVRSLPLQRIEQAAARVLQEN